MLIETFGEEYKSYKDATGIFSPKFPRRSI
jgi:protein-S-isoprenylcysteine O-methyltransferase Ste14